MNRSTNSPDCAAATAASPEIFSSRRALAITGRRQHFLYGGGSFRKIATTIISVSCLLGLLFIAPSALAKKAKPKSRASKTAVANPNTKFQNDTNAALRDMTAELKAKVTQDDLKGIRDDLKKVEQKADETAVEVRIAMLVGAAIAVVLGVLIYRLFSRIVPDSGKLSIT